MKVVDLFCGIGGFSEGARQCGHDVVLAVDADQHALTAHERNHPSAEHKCLTLPSDEVTLPHPGETWHLHGSPPCQALSAARRTSLTPDMVDASVELVTWFLELASSSQPTSWSMEQVAAPRVIALLTQFRDRRPEWYDFEVTNAVDFGIPQTRRRVIAGDPVTIARLRANRSPKVVTLREVFEDELCSEWVMNSTTNQPVRDGTAKFRKMRPEEHMRSVDQPCYTVLARHPLRWVDPRGSVIRNFTPEEGARVQTFPANYDLGTAHRQRHVGNALPPTLATCFLERIRPA